MIETIVTVAISVFVGALAALKFFAPRTKTTKDDAVLAALEKAEPFVEQLKDKATKPKV